ncbi:MAG: glutamate--tRNA ligase [Candidatus Obscuribacterales bacterium]|nr:glutamate--tRNA ligase [Candidatus Obscuribacterales bacterium]
MTEVRVRIAPSPTGNLHLGTARTALYNYLFAKKHKGKFVLRLEDTDNERSDEKYTKDIIDGLKWLGLSWDEGCDIGGPYPPYRQTEKIDHYEHIADKLLTNGFAYLCYATPEELAAMKEEQKQKGKSIRYDNRSRDLSDEARSKYEAEGRLPSFRFRIDEPQDVRWDDEIKGPITVNTSDLGGDMVIIKSNGVATYNFAVVIDDIDMQMTHVLRGEDHIHNTAKQLLLFEALNCKAPHYGHTGLIFDSNDRKLSKREHGELVHIDFYRIEGYMPEAIVNYLIKTSWTPPNDWTSANGTDEIFSLIEAEQIFDIKRVSKAHARFDMDKLNWYNAHYLRSLPLSTVTERARPYLTDFDLSECSNAELEKLVGAVRDGLTKLSEIKAAARFFFGNLVDVPLDVKEQVLSSDDARKVLGETLSSLSKMPFEDPKGVKHVVDTLGKELGIKGKNLYWPLRAALSGSTQGPDLGSMMSVLGPNKVQARLKAALSNGNGGSHV